MQVLHSSQIQLKSKEESNGKITETLLSSNIWRAKGSDTSYAHSHLFQTIWRTPNMQDGEEDEEENDEKDEEQDRKQDEKYVPDQGQYDFDNALQAAAHQSDSEVIEIDSEVVESDSEVVESDSEVVELLYKKGADVDAKVGDGGTALIKAAQSGDEAVVQLLLEKGA